MKDGWKKVSEMTEEEFREDRKKAGWSQNEIDTMVSCLRWKLRKPDEIANPGGEG